MQVVTAVNLGRMEVLVSQRVSFVRKLDTSRRTAKRKTHEEYILTVSIYAVSNAISSNSIKLILLTFHDTCIDFDC